MKTNGYCCSSGWQSSPCPASTGKEYHVTVGGSSTGDGSLASPWDLQTAFGGGNGAVHAGDTIWIHGGMYANPNNGQANQVAWESTMSGTSGLPIIVRAYPGDHPVLDGKDSQQDDILRVSSNYVWYWGLEIMSSDNGRIDNTDDAPYQDYAGSYPNGALIRRGQGININQSLTLTGNKFINCVVHDCTGGFSSTGITDDSQLYGCLFYNNGWYNSYFPRHHHGHNIYVHNATGEVKSFYDVITWGAFENNVQAWAGDGSGNTNDLIFDGFVSFLYGTQKDGAGLLLGNYPSFKNPTITNSMFYQDLGSPSLQLGYDNGSSYPVSCIGGNISNNYIGGGEIKIALAGGSFSGTSFDNNTIWYEALEGSLPSGSGNTIVTSRPSTNHIFVRRNQYETGRAHVVVYNWENASSVSVDLSPAFIAGDTYTIVDAQNPSMVLLTGNYSGPVSIPMMGTTIAQPIGDDTEGRTHTPSEFGVFIATGGSVPPP